MAHRHMQSATLAFFQDKKAPADVSLPSFETFEEALGDAAKTLVLAYQNTRFRHAPDFERYSEATSTTHQEAVTSEAEAKTGDGCNAIL